MPVESGIPAYVVACGKDIFYPRRSEWLDAGMDLYNPPVL